MHVFWTFSWNFIFFHHFSANLIFLFFTKIAKNDRKMFLIKILTKIYFWQRNLIFQSPGGRQNAKNRPSTILRWQTGPEIQKHTDHFDIFPVPERIIWDHQPIDRDLSCSEHFFLLPGGSDSVPNGLISIFPFSPFFRFWHFSWFSLNFNFFRSILCHFSNFFHKILPEPPL